MNDGTTDPTHCAIWAKTFPCGGIKSLPAHLLDVAAVAWELQARNPARVDREARAVGIDPDTLLRLRVWLAAIHDLGKCSAAFQSKSRDRVHWPEALLGPFRQPKDPGHWRSTATLLRHRAIWPLLLEALPAVPPEAMKTLLNASAGHHGRPPDDADWSRPVEPVIGQAALAIARRIFSDITGIVPPPSDLSLSREQSKVLSWQTSGLITVADWVGSDAEIFGPASPGDLGAYFVAAREVARKALAIKGLLPLAPTDTPGLRAVAPEIGAPRPMQCWADQVDLPLGPCLAVIEDVTGSGKTEAALALASRMIAAGKGEGIYFALPTEATANAMFDRLATAHRGFFAAGAKPSLVLAHGRAHLSEPFAKVTRAPDASAEAQCNAWIADHRRKAFFAHVGAGTIDQAFLAILRKRHLTLRQFGLAGRVLIVDEAHAYDAYMEEELTRLLALHESAGGSAIVLSATLPRCKRRSISRVYRADFEPEQANFPLATIAARSGTSETPIGTAATSHRRVEVRRVDSAESMHFNAAQAARNGAAVLVLRNAVDEAVASAEALRSVGLPVDLFHARFAYVDRERIERRVLARFGKDGTARSRAGQVLIATQVVEQSLDVDFDVIFTDLAPIDLMIQRAGRLWRHDRHGRAVAAPTLHVLSPGPALGATVDWLAPCLGAGAHVYHDPGVMWRSARALFGAGCIETPSGLRALIEAVYGPDAEALPERFERAMRGAEGADQGNRACARFNTIELAEGYGPALGDLPKNQEIGTRLGDDVRVVRLARLAGETVVPWAEGPQEWARSELRVRLKWLRGKAEPPDLSLALAAARADWPGWDDALIGVVDARGALLLEGGSCCLRYDRDLGLIREAG